MRALITHYKVLKPAPVNVDVLISYAEGATKEAVIEALGSAMGRALREVTTEFDERTGRSAQTEHDRT